MGSLRLRFVAVFISIIFVLLSALLVTGCGDNSSSETPRVLATTFSKTFGGSGNDSASSVQQTSDGGYIMAGGTSSFGSGGDAYLVKTDTAGNLLWQKNFGGSEGDDFSSVQQTSDGGYIMAGGTDAYELECNAYLVKTDTAGNLLWGKTFSSGVSYAYSVQQTSDGGYVLAGYVNSDAYLAKIDASGNLLWDKTFGGADVEIGTSVQQTSDGGYVMAGYTGPLNGKKSAYLVKTDASGNLLWEKTISSSEYTAAYSVQQTSDGGYVLAGYTGDDAYLAKTDAAGNLLWEKAFGDLIEYVYSVQQATDGGYALAGRSTTGGSSVNAYLAKTDAAGNLLWDKTFGIDEGYDGFSSVQQTTDGGYILAGSTGGTYNKSDVYLVKTDTEGNSSGGGGGSEETVPVVLVHGWNGSPSNWDTLVSALEAKGMVKWNEGDDITNKSILVFDYEDDNHGNPTDIAKKIDDFVNDNLGSWIAQGKKFDIVCHSMGALVTRWWMEEPLEDKKDNLTKVRQWIGIAPTSHGSATANLCVDLYGQEDTASNSMFGEAVVQLQTNSTTVVLLDALFNESKDDDGIQEGISAGVKYHVLVGVNTDHKEDFYDNYLLEKGALNLKGQTLNQPTPKDNYLFRAEDSTERTWLGDSFVSTNQSMLDGATNEYFEGLTHNKILKDTDVCEAVWGYLINPSKVISQDSADDGLVTVPNIIGMRIGDANSAIEGVGLVLYVNGCSMDGSKHEVTKQDPPVGTKVTKGTTIEIFYDGELE